MWVAFAATIVADHGAISDILASQKQKAWSGDHAFCLDYIVTVDREQTGVRLLPVNNRV